MQTTTYQTVTLRVPCEPSESHPSQWDWQALIDSIEPVEVIAGPRASIAFDPEAFESAAAFFSQLCANPDRGPIARNGDLGYHVRVVPVEGEPFEAEARIVTVGEDGQYKLTLAPTDEGTPDYENLRVLDIYDEIERVEVL